MCLQKRLVDSVSRGEKAWRNTFLHRDWILIVFCVCASAGVVTADEAHDANWKRVSPSDTNGYVTPLGSQVGAGNIVTLTTTHGLPSNQIVKVVPLFAKEDGIVVATTRGLSILKDDACTTFVGPHVDLMSREKLPGNSPIPGQWIQDILVTPDKTLWIASSHGLCRVRGDRWEVYEHKSRRGESLDGMNDIQKLFRAKDGRVFVGTRCAGVVVARKRDGAMKTLYRNNDLNNWVTGFAEDKRSKIWISVFGLGVLEYDGEGFLLHTAETPWLPNVELRCLCIDRSGAMWLGTDQGLAVRFKDGSTDVFDESRVLPGKQVAGIKEQQDGSVWVYTNKGFAVFQSGQWTYPIVPNLATEWLGFGEGLCELGNRTIAVSTLNGAVLNPKLEIAKANPVHAARIRIQGEIEKNHPRIPNDKHVKIDGGGRVWWYDGEKLRSYDGKRWQDPSVMIGEEGLIFMFADSKGRVWVSTWASGLLEIQPGQLPRVINLEDEKPVFAAKMAESPDGTIFLNSGRHRMFKLGIDEWSRLGEDEFPSGHLQIGYMEFDKNGDLWVSDLNYGLFSFKRGSWHHWSMEKPLLHRQIVDLEPLDSGNMRVKTGFWSPSGYEVRSFDIEEHEIVPVASE